MSPRADLPRSSGEDPTALVELIPALRAFARTFCRSKSDADDLVQETLTKAIANLDRYEPGTRLKSWLFTIMRNSFLNRVSKERRRSAAATAYAAAPAAREAPQEWSAQVRDVRAAIERLPQGQREVLVLVGVIGVSYEEAAAICNCAVGTVKSRLNRARAGLLADLAGAPGAGPEARTRPPPLRARNHR